MTQFKTSRECTLELVAHTTTVEGQAKDNWLPVSAARASFGREDKTGENPIADAKLMQFLADHKHVSCFQHNYATFLVECPIFIARQIMRHSSFDFNEISRRYTSEEIAFWKPEAWRKQAEQNKQCSDGELALEDSAWEWDYGQEQTAAYKYYCSLLYTGVAREQARAVLPQSLLTRFYMTGNLRSWWSFISQRTEEYAQEEVRIVAERIKEKLFTLWPTPMNALFGGN